MMIVNMSFDRFRFQTQIETYVGCSDLSKWKSYKQRFENFEVTTENIEILKGCLYQDGLDHLYKGIYSISNGLFNINNKYYSWSIIKFYYSIFYLMRSNFAASNIGFLKNGGIYTLDLKIGEKPIRRDQGNYKGERCTGDHKTTIATHIKEFSLQDIMLTNSVQGENIYDWLMDIRNQVNYRERCFHEPDFKYFPSGIFDENEIKNTIESYFDDTDLVYCFNEDHAAIAAPIKILQLVCAQYYAKTNLRLSKQRADLIIEMPKPMGLDELIGFKNILNSSNELPEEEVSELEEV